jgi:hypothetical protein
MSLCRNVVSGGETLSASSGWADAEADDPLKTLGRASLHSQSKLQSRRDQEGRMANWVRLQVSDRHGSVGYRILNLDAALWIEEWPEEHLPRGGGSRIVFSQREQKVDASVDEVFAMAKKGQTP